MSGVGSHLIVCASVHHGNTARVARVMAVELEAELVGPEEVSGADLVGRTLVGFGSGVFHGRLHGALFELVRGLPDRAEPATRAFVFSTSGLPWLSRAWHAPLERLLRRKGFEVVGDFSCRGFDTWGPLGLVGGLNRGHPDERDIDRAREFARRMAAPTARRARA